MAAAGSKVEIAAFAFQRDRSLTEVHIPDSVTSIGDGAFDGCISLTKVRIPDSVTSIGDWAFSCCSSLTEVRIPDSVRSIGDWAFCGCSSLTEVRIPDSVRRIGEGTFDGCSSLTAVRIPDSVTTIGVEAFVGCHSLTEVHIPDSVTSIGEGAFVNCSSLTEVRIPNSVSRMSPGSFGSTTRLVSRPAVAGGGLQEMAKQCEKLEAKCWELEFKRKRCEELEARSKEQLELKRKRCEELEAKCRELELRDQEREELKAKQREELEAKCRELDLKDKELALAVMAPLAWPAHGVEFGVEPLVPGDLVRTYVERLLTSSCVRHRRDQYSAVFHPAPVMRVLKVEVVVNPRLAKAYHSKAEEVHGLRRGHCSAIPPLAHLKIPPRKGASPAWPDLNEHFLFHGATEDVVLEISKAGFDPRRGGEGFGKLFGVATYLAANASKADIYTEHLARRLPRQAERKVVVVRALLGEAHRTTCNMSSATRPPNGADGRPLDSVWADARSSGGCVDHLEAMIFDKGQAYPEYIATYVHEPSCRCAECAKRPAT